MRVARLAQTCGALASRSLSGEQIYNSPLGEFYFEPTAKRSNNYVSHYVWGIWKELID